MPRMVHAAVALYVVVRLYDMQSVPPDTLQTARNTAAGIMKTSGIDVRWASCPCPKPAGPVELMVRVAQAGAGSNPASLGFSYVDVDRRAGTLATVFADRVHALASQARADEGELLGRAMAHEMAHLLLGTHDHSRSGLMRGKWTTIELSKNQPIDWQLERSDSAHLRQALMRRINEVRTERVLMARGEWPAQNFSAP
jgi:hypothetical protein